MEIIIDGGQHLSYHLWINVARCASFPIRFKNFQKKSHRIEPIDIFDSLYGDKHQVKVTCKTTAFGWVWLVEPLVQ